MKKAFLTKYKNTEEPAIMIMFDFDWATVENVKTLPNRKFYDNGNNRKYWLCPYTTEAVEKLKSWNFELDSKLEEYYNRSINTETTTLPNITIPELDDILYPFQKEAVAFIEAKNGRALLALDMGLGKSIISLSWLKLHNDKKPVLIVCPATLKLNWLREINKWFPDENNIQILSGKYPSEDIYGDIVIINYDILSDWVDVLINVPFKVMILDESHFIKNRAANRTKAVKTISKKIPHILALTGTPILNRPIEIYNVLKILAPNHTPNFWEYVNRYCGARHNGFGWDFNGATNIDELHNRLTSTIMFRRLKKDVLQDLPDKVRTYIPIELDNKNTYIRAEEDFVDFIYKTKGKNAAMKISSAEAIAKVEVLKQVAVKGKLNQVKEWIKDFLATDGKLVVFAIHRFVIDELMKEFKDIAVKVDGSVTRANRDKAVQAFQNDDNIRLFIGNINAAGVGLTLTAASSVAFIELPWSPALLDQAEDRCHRIGQKDTVNIYYLLGVDTIEERIVKMLDSKRKILDTVLDGKTTSPESLLSELIKSYDKVL